MIRVKQLHLENVGPFKAQDFDFSIQEGHPDIHIFTGINGTGKTTILHAVAAMFDHFEQVSLHKPYTTNAFFKRFHLPKTNDIHSKDPVSAVLGSVRGGNEALEYVCFICDKCGNIHRSNNQGYEIPKPYDSDLSIEIATWLQSYINVMNSNEFAKEGTHFAAFGYSGYRFISSSPIRLGNEDNFNPLQQALDFRKKDDPNYNILNWIASRSASAAVEGISGNTLGAKRTREALDALIQYIEALSEDYKFSIKTNPWKVAIQYFDQEVEFDVLPDGFRSVLSWMGDLLMRMDNIHWVDKSIPVNEQHIILLLDEIEVHLHPKWQYQILPLTQKIFPNAQIFLTTHSPFILNSIDNAKIYRLKTDRGEASLEDFVLSETGNSYSYVYENILDTHNIFGPDVTKALKRFNELDKQIAKQDFTHEAEFIQVVQSLLEEGEEVADMIGSKLMRLKRITGKDYFHGENHEKTAV